MGSKLFEALDELREKRRKIDDAISHLSAAITALGLEMEAGSDVEAQAIVTVRSRRRSSLSLIDQAALILRRGPMAVVDLAKAVSEVIGREVSRATLDGGISREIREDGESSRFVRCEPAVYALSEAGAVFVKRHEDQVDADEPTLLNSEVAA